MADGGTLVEKALWLIESRLGSEISLAEIATTAGVSRFHLLRAFGDATGHSVMRYVRARRLTIAAHRLAAGAADILQVALDAGYGSHEAFTRAFRDQFGMTPDAVRTQGHNDNIAVVEAITLDNSRFVQLEPPRFEEGRELLIAGLGTHCSFETNLGIPFLWQRFRPYIGHVTGQVGSAAYGVCCNGDDLGTFDYIAGVEVTNFADLPNDLSRIRIPRRRYAVFAHQGHVSTLRRFVHTIWSKWLPCSSHMLADSPDFERYGEDFDAESGIGTVEIWLPLED
jgi:AraC family transcriptional regulator